ncbi:MAG: hypothetical protein JW841_08665 [Deltaproteobacteria bacterium]|nr:hypothetical protein [Deltaproteobacteria bacterium]
MIANQHWSLCLLAGMLLSCSGVSEERVAALEEQLAALKQQQSTNADGSTQVREDVTKQISSVQESQKNLEATLETISRELAKVVAQKNEPKAKAKPAPTTNSWALTALVLGLKPNGNVNVEGDNYSVNRQWLIEELRFALAKKQVPKLTFDRKNQGVALRGVKPKSLFTMLGAKNNDVIMAIGGQNTSSVQEIMDALKQTQSPVVIKIKRKGKELQQQYILVD